MSPPEQKSLLENDAMIKHLLGTFFDHNYMKNVETQNILLKFEKLNTTVDERVRVIDGLPKDSSAR